jgi:hypothetical protein
MNLKEFAELIVEMHSRTRNPEEVEVILPVTNLWPAVGPSSAIKVDGAYNGFDWDANRFFIRPEFPIAVIGPEYEKSRKNARDLSEKLGWIYLTLNSKSLTDAQKLAEIKKALKRP